MRRAFIFLAGAALAGCATLKEMERKGFSTEFLLEDERANWGQPQGVWSWQTRAMQMGVPVDSTPLAIRDLRCRRYDGHLYSCDYLIDYGRNGQIEGTYRKRDELIGQDSEGNWSVGWIILT